MTLIQELPNRIEPSGPLENRQAACGGIHEKDHSTTGPHEVRDSHPSLAFFEYRGEGSDFANMCAGCHFTQTGHDVYGVTFSGEHSFKRHGPWEYDAYYCGHAGWD